MVIGRTGMGKSTTADKLVIANPEGHDYRGEQHEDQRDEQVQVDNLSIWNVANVEGEEDRVTIRLKNLIMYRSLDTPHKEVNTMYAMEQQITTGSQVISNETTKIRVLDVPGFFGEDFGKMGTKTTSAERVTTSGLRIMREIYIQAKMRMNFRRIIYFIPERGSLERSHKVLLMELEHMTHYFGKSIFESAVLATTMPQDIYKFIPKDVTPFSDDAVAKTRAIFTETLAQVLSGNEQLPNDQPPIVFISMHDSCEDILAKVKEARVVRQELKLAFDDRTCVRCGLKAKIFTYGNNRKRRVACYSGQDPSMSVPYEDSHCHPLLISKYWTITKIVGGIAHFITKKRFHGRWPDFQNPDDQVCIACGKMPGEQGCKKVGTYYQLNEQRIFVNHSPTEPTIFEDYDEIRMVIPTNEHRMLEQWQLGESELAGDPEDGNRAEDVLESVDEHKPLPEGDTDEPLRANLPITD